MKKVVPIVVVLIGFATYVYFARIRPSREHDPTVRGSGSIEAVDVTVAPRIAARIVSVNVREGDVVEAGRTLVVLECSDLEARRAQAEAQVTQAVAGLEQARASLAQVLAQVRPLDAQKEGAERERARASALRDANSAPQAAVDQAETAVKTIAEQIGATRAGAGVARRAVTVAEAQVELAKKSLRVAEVALGECELHAPMDGVVVERVREPGELALPGTAILRIARLEEVHTWVYVPNEDVGRVRLGQQVRLRADTYPERVFVGLVSRIADRAEFTPKSVQTKDDRTRLVFGVKVSVANADRALMPGMPVEAEFVGSGSLPAAPPSTAGR